MLRLPTSAAAFLLLFVNCSYAPAQSKPRFLPEEDSVMSPIDVAKTLGVQKLFELVVKNRSSSSESLKVVMARQKLIQEVTIASLQLDATAGQIDALNLVSLVAGGSLGTASASLGLVGEGKASSVSGILAGGVAAGLSAIGLKRRNGSAQPLQVPANMLANLFDQPVVANNIYPPVVSAFMQSVAPNEREGLNRKERLIRSWIEVGRLPEPNSDKGTKKIGLLTSMPSQGRLLSIRDLNDRQAMLHDFRAKLLYLKRDLTLLLASVPNDFALE